VSIAVKALEIVFVIGCVWVGVLGALVGSLAEHIRRSQ
jgi:hypothetical protein